VVTDRQAALIEQQYYTVAIQPGVDKNTNEIERIIFFAGKAGRSFYRSSKLVVSKFYYTGYADYIIAESNIERLRGSQNDWIKTSPLRGLITILLLFLYHNISPMGFPLKTQ